MIARWGIAVAIFALLAAVHYPYLHLPYFWDELGQFIPASLDLFYTADWIPVTTTPNIHPPGVMAYLATAWRIFGGAHSILVTRLAMLALAAFGALGSFLLAIRLGRSAPGYPAIAAILFLLASPLFYAQSMLAQLDMPAMAFTVWALLLFFERRYAWAAAACAALAMSKETGAILPAMFAAWLLVKERKFRPAVYFALSILPLAVWVAFLWKSTGHLLGDTQFAQYNAIYSLHPVRLAAAVARRLFYLFVAEFRWIGLVAIILSRSVFRTAEWAWAAAFTATHILVVSIFGGAVLERYLLPVLPVLYAAMGCAFTGLAAVDRDTRKTGPASIVPGQLRGLTAGPFALQNRRLQFWAPAVLCLGLLLSIFWGPPYLTPFENNIAFTDFVQLQEEAAVFLNRMPDRPRSVASAWPFTDALRRPVLGYTPRSFETVVETSDFRRPSVEQALAKHGAPVDAVVLYDRLHEPSRSLSAIPWVRTFLARYYDYAPQITAEEMLRLGYVQQIRMEQRGQWIAVYTPRRAPL